MTKMWCVSNEGVNGGGGFFCFFDKELAIAEFMSERKRILSDHSSRVMLLPYECPLEDHDEIVEFLDTADFGVFPWAALWDAIDASGTKKRVFDLEKRTLGYYLDKKA